MAKAAATLLIDLRADIGKLSADMNKARQQTAIAMAKLNKQASIKLALDGTKAALQAFAKIGQFASKIFKQITDAAATVQFNASMDALAESWQGFLRAVGESITRSEAFNAALRDTAKWLTKVSGGTGDLGTVIGDGLAAALVAVRSPLSGFHGIMVGIHFTVGHMLKSWGMMITAMSKLAKLSPLVWTDIPEDLAAIGKNLDGVGGDNFKEMQKEANAAVRELDGVIAGLAAVNAASGKKSTSAHTKARGKKGATPAAPGAAAPMVFDAFDVSFDQAPDKAPDNRAALARAQIEQMQPAMDGLIASMERLNEKYQETQANIGTVAAFAASTLADTLSAPFRDGFENWAATLAGLKDMMIDLIAQMAIAATLKAVLSPASFAASGAGGSIGGILAGALGFAEGGRVPGSGSGDTVPAWLTPGEFVVPADTVRKYGSSFFANLDAAPRFASGGMVGAASGAAGGGGGGLSLDGLTINLSGGAVGSHDQMRRQFSAALRPALLEAATTAEKRLAAVTGTRPSR